MAQIGYWMASEEHRPDTMVSLAQKAEEVGFPYVVMSDHYHPWTDRQHDSPFVWSVLGGIASTTKRIHAGTGVTCPIMRIHPAVLAQAAATTAAMMPGRFFLGVGTGEALNEHILGDKWPPFATRLEMLEEAVEIMRELWQGGLKNHEGPYFIVENARLYTLPPSPPPIVMAASGPKAAEAAGRIADGLIGTVSNKEVMRRFEVGAGRRGNSGLRPPSRDSSSTSCRCPRTSRRRRA
jgi:G6PDH family F420-dependent oxidoreductase